MSTPIRMENYSTYDPSDRDWNLEGKYLEGGVISMVSEPGGNKVTNYKDLWIYVQSRLLVTDIYRLTRKLPKEEVYGLTSQLRRASVSVPSNIAEGWGRNKNGYFLLGMSYSRGSIHEVETQLLICSDLEFLTHDEINPLLGKIAAISAGLLKFMNKLDTKR